MSLFRESSTASATDSSSNIASSSSTPPTTVADSASQSSETSVKHDVITVQTNNAPLPSPPPTSASPSEPAPSRSRRSRLSAPVYNLVQLSGTAGHGKRRSKGDVVTERNRRRRTISGDTLVEGLLANTRSPSARSLAKSRRSMDASEFANSPASAASPRTRRQARESPRTLRASMRSASGAAASRAAGVSNLSAKMSKIKKRGSKMVKGGMSRVSRELMRLQDTNEFSGIEDKPVLHTVWANGKFVDPNEPPPKPTRTKSKAEQEPEEEKAKEESSEPVINTRERRVKKFLSKGLYSGQQMPADITKGLTLSEKKQLATMPELAKKPRPNSVMPPVIYTGFRTLLAGRDFTLPYLTCNPLPPGQPKPDEWKKVTKNRFVGDSKDYWRKSPHLLDMSKCVCKPEDGCGDNCQNRIMLYECNDGNCGLGRDMCTNRAFADLMARRAKGGKYRVGVEVIKTSDRGYGVRSNRCFEANQIIMEYAGEIITDEECERRMNEVYKNNACYYLMSFDQNMIIDATTGSIARFVNHSCNPNCRMVKWIVAGQPRMALFAGDNPITTGDELTYDYNFDPFSAKNVQKCLCGAHNCRGVLGPRPREQRPPKADLKKAVKATVKAGKRKLKEFVGDDGDAGGNNAKKRKIKPATGVKRSLSNASLKAAKGAAKGAASVLKKSVSNLSLNPKKGNTLKRRASTGGLLKKATTKSMANASGRKVTGKVSSSRSSSLTLVGTSDENVRAGKKGTPKKGSAKGTPKKATPKSTSKATPKTTPSKSTPKKGTPSKKATTKKTTPGTASPRARKAPIKKATVRRVSTSTVKSKGQAKGKGKSPRKSVDGDVAMTD